MYRIAACEDYLTLGAPVGACMRDDGIQDMVRDGLSKLSCTTYNPLHQSRGAFEQVQVKLSPECFAEPHMIAFFYSAQLWTSLPGNTYHLQHGVLQKLLDMSCTKPKSPLQPKTPALLPPAARGRCKIENDHERRCHAPEPVQVAAGKRHRLTGHEASAAEPPLKKQPLHLAPAPSGHQGKIFNGVSRLHLRPS